METVKSRDFFCSQNPANLKETSLVGVSYSNYLLTLVAWSSCTEYCRCWACEELLSHGFSIYILHSRWKKKRRCTFMQCELMLNFLHPVEKKSNHTFTNLNTGWIIGNTRGSGLQVRFYKANWVHIAFLWGELNTYWSTARSDIKLLQVSHMTVHNKMCMKSKLF